MVILGLTLCFTSSIVLSPAVLVSPTNQYMYINVRCMDYTQKKDIIALYSNVYVFY